MAQRDEAGRRWGGDVESLRADLQSRIAGEVRFDPESRALYATDASNYRQVPIGVVLPRTVQDVVETVGVCRDHAVPLLPRGAGTSLAGQCCNVAVVLDCSRHMDRVLEIDPVGRTARVEPGVVLDRLRGTAERHGLTFGPDPATHTHCTLGGMIGNDSCGVHSMTAGRTSDNVEALEVLTYDGLKLRVGATSPAEIASIVGEGGRRGAIYAQLEALRDRVAPLVRARYPDIPRRVSGYSLDALLPEKGFHVARALVGTEGTCVTVLEATLRLVPSPPFRVLLVLGYPDIFHAADQVPEVLETDPMGLEGFDDHLVRQQKKKGMHPEALATLPAGGGFMLAEYGGDTPHEAASRAAEAGSRLGRGPRAPSGMHLVDDAARQRSLWQVRESALGATARVPGDPDRWEGWEDSAVAPGRLGPYLRELRALFDRHGYDGAFYGHFGQGCVHTRVSFDFKTAEGVVRMRSCVEEAADLVVRYGGSLSGEHGDGQSRAELLPRMFGPDLVDAFRAFKTIWDPLGRMNPGKVVDPYRLDENLRVSPELRLMPIRTHFSYSEDDGDFSRAVLRCVGVGKCRREEGGTMCPSWRVTHEEAHATRGRARLLFEMLQGDIVRGGFRNPQVREALDLCLACKGCKSDCPVGVDMATYKSEFLAHHYAGRLRPASAYALGLVPWWSRLAARAPGVVNAALRAPGLGSALRRAAGIAPERRVPAFAPRTFRWWFERREKQLGPPVGSDAGRMDVILWPDTFHDHFHPQVAQAGVEVLEGAGCRVLLPPPGLCCGRPLYDFGMLRLARRQLERILDALRPQLRAGIPVIGLEPSCVAVFRDELPGLMPGDDDALMLSQRTFLLSEFLETQRPDWTPPVVSGKALVHVHCHHKSVLKDRAERALLARCGLEVGIPESGCCGMAGAFGFERRHYALSMQIAERALLPAVRAADEDTLIVANGFSCREQIAQGTGRQPLHLAEVLQRALRSRERTHVDYDSHPDMLPLVERNSREDGPNDAR